MPFKTLEEANAYRLEQTQKYNDLLLSKQGLESKLSTLEKTNEDSQKEIDRLKIKNYEYFEKISVQTSGKQTTQDEDEEEIEIKLEDVIKDI